MSKEIKNRIVPKLRFPEFKSSNGWQIMPLGELIEIKGRIGYRGYTIEDIVNKGEGAISLSPSNINDDGNISFDKSTYISWAKYDESPEIMLEEGFTVLVKTGSTFGKTAIIKKLPVRATVNPQIVVLKPVRINDFFLYLLVSHPIVQKQINETVVGGAIPTLSQDSVTKFEVVVPSKTEQQKIADSLSSLDDYLTAQSQKLDALKAHKKGLMQQLFPAEGETVPKLRFREFRNSGEWKEKTLKDVCQMQAGKFVSASEISETKNDSLFPCYGGNGLRGFTKSYTHNGNYSLIGRQGALCGNVTLVDGKFHATEHAVVVTPKKGVATTWLFYMLTHLNLNQYATGQAQPGLSVDNLDKVEIKIPNTENEQQKIADCLSSLDDLITAQAEKIEALKRHKKGLMQGLFPVSNNDYDSNIKPYSDAD